MSRQQRHSSRQRTCNDDLWQRYLPKANIQHRGPGSATSTALSPQFTWSMDAVFSLAVPTCRRDIPASHPLFPTCSLIHRKPFRPWQLVSSSGQFCSGEPAFPQPLCQRGTHCPCPAQGAMLKFASVPKIQGVFSDCSPSMRCCSFV